MRVRIRHGVFAPWVVLVACLAAAAPARGGFLPVIIAGEVSGAYDIINPPAGVRQPAFRLEGGEASTFIPFGSTAPEPLLVQRLVSLLDVGVESCLTKATCEATVVPRLPIGPTPQQTPFTIYNEFGGPMVFFDLFTRAVVDILSESSVKITTSATLAMGSPGQFPDGFSRLIDVSNLSEFELILEGLMIEPAFGGPLDSGPSLAGMFGTATWPMPPGGTVSARWRLFVPTGGAVPEPASLALAATGLLMAAGCGWSRKRRLGRRSVGA